MELNIAALVLFVGVLFFFYAAYLHTQDSTRKYEDHREQILFFIELMDILNIDREITFQLLRDTKTLKELKDMNKKMITSIKKHNI